MAAVRHLLKEMETRTLVWLAKSRLSSVVIVGTLAAAGLGAGVLSVQSSSVAHPGQAISITGVMTMSDYGCHNDPDGDGHIFCDGSTPISQLPASYGQCQVATFDNVQIVCEGTGSGW